MDFRGDERGQPVVIGALLIFAILILAFSGYQAVVVPNQNADVEFQHSQDVQDDVVDLRIAVVRTAIANSDTSTGVQLGTRYPSRLIALNPPPPSGTLRTTEPGDIVVDGANEDDIDVCPSPSTSREFVYSPDYNEFQGGAPLLYENTFAYSQHRDGETREVLKTSQRLVDVDDGVIRLVALEGEYSESGTQRVDVDLIRGGTRVREVNSPNITLPTRIENQSTWEEILEGDYSIEDFQSGKSITFKYNGRFNVRCTPVGINRAPQSGSASLNGGGGTGGSGGGSTTQSDRVAVTNAEATGNDNSNISFTLNNTGSTSVTIEQIAINSTTAKVDYVNRDFGNEFEQTTGDGRLNSTLYEGETPSELDVYADIAGNDNDDFILGQFIKQSGPNENPVDMTGEETVITLVFSDGSSGQYTLNT